jgi:hypothetical protein
MGRSKVILVIGAVLVAMVAMDVPGASATELCKAAETECASENLELEGTAVTAKASKPEIVTSLLTVTCASSTLEGKTTADVGVPLKITAETFTECKTGETKCTVSALHLPYYGELEYTGTNAGTLGITDWGEGNPGASVECGGSIKCNLTAKELALSAKGGSPAKLEATKDALTVESGSVCPKTASLTAGYSVSAPTTMQVNQIDSRICKMPPTANVCAIGDRYSGDPVFEMTSAQAKIKTAAPEAAISCEESTLAGELFTSIGGGVLKELKLDTAGLACNSTIPGGNPGVKITVDGLPSGSLVELTRALKGYMASIQRQAARKITLELQFMPVVTCHYITTRPLWKQFSTNPMMIESQWLSTRTGMNPPMQCPVGLEVETKYKVTQTGGGNLWGITW